MLIGFLLTLVLAAPSAWCLRREFLISLPRMSKWIPIAIGNLLGIVGIVIFDYNSPTTWTVEKTSIFLFCVATFVWALIEEYIKLSAARLASIDNSVKYEYTAASAIVFAVLENFLYAVTSTTMYSIVTRGLFGPIMHASFSLVAAYFFRKNKPLKGILWAAIVHATHNLCVFYKIPVLDFVLCLCCFVFLIIVVRNEQNPNLAKSNIH